MCSRYEQKKQRSSSFTSPLPPVNTTYDINDTFLFFSPILAQLQPPILSSPNAPHESAVALFLFLPASQIPFTCHSVRICTRLQKASYSARGLLCESTADLGHVPTPPSRRCAMRKSGVLQTKMFFFYIPKSFTV